MKEGSVKFCLKNRKIIGFYSAFISEMLCKINSNIERALQVNPGYNIKIIKEIEWNIETFFGETQTGFKEVINKYEVREDAYENPRRPLDIVPICHKEKNPESLPYKFIRALHAADRIIVTQSEILNDFDLIGIPGARDWSDSEKDDYYYTLMIRRGDWIERTRVVFDKANRRFKNDILYE
jgi:hypothetical protein